MLRLLWPLVLLVWLNPVCAAGHSQPIHALSVLARVRANGVVRCGSPERPGVAEPDSGAAGMGPWRGVAVDICRALAAAVLGAADRIEHRVYATALQYQRVRRRLDDVYFLTGREMVRERLIGELVPGPAVFIASDAVMVPGDSPVQHLAELAGQGVCYMIADTAELSLGAYFSDRSLSWQRHAYSEQGEMEDAYAVQRCHGVAAESTELARIRLLPGPARLNSRILPEPLRIFPILATTARADAQWSAIVDWTVHTLIAAEAPRNEWRAGGADAMPIPATALGLSGDWQRRVLQATGHYGDIYWRNLGAGSRYRLERGLNANAVDGGLQLAPVP